MNQVLHGSFYSALDECNICHQSYMSNFKLSTTRVVHNVHMKFEKTLNKERTLQSRFDREKFEKLRKKGKPHRLHDNTACSNHVVLQNPPPYLVLLS